ncbi:hypothetical protein HRH25_23655 [Flavisolibacter sp. BT320]|nr:hypothetical protein [Flavisolibacter longurius]
MLFKLSCLIFCFMLNEAKSQMNYKVLPTKQCIAYIESQGLTVDDWDTTLSIPSGYGFLYSLPTKEIVLIPTRTGMPYEGFIYKNKAAFERMVQEDFFPLSEQYLTYWEMERDNLKSLPASVPYFESLLQAELQLNTVLRNPEGLEKVYHLLVKFIKEKKSKNLNERVVLAYAILVMDYLVRTKGAEWEIAKRYEIYNSYFDPIVILDDEWKDVVGNLFATLQEPKGNYRYFRESAGL